jgi:alpha-L-fucosidase
MHLTTDRFTSTQTPALRKAFLCYLIVSVLFLELSLTAISSAAIDAPQPYGPVPTERQLRWSRLDAYAFVHLGINTFTDKEWGYGDESEKLFNPTDFNADQIVAAAKSAGLRGVILTCKHHDGFCLWPTAYTEHSIKNSPWKDGKGDMVREVSDACHRQGMLFGVYLSPWDRNSSVYGSPQYITYYRNQLRELLTHYGPIFEIWLDGANGGDGYYGGARETRKIDNRVYYDWANTIKIIRELQPDCAIFSDGGPDCRWVGNEQGHAGETCWQTFNADGVFPGHADSNQLNHGNRPGTHWMPAEVDVSIRPGWFYHANQDDKVKPPARLTEIYFQSVGRGANLILNLPPDRRGQIPDEDVKSLTEWHRILSDMYARNFAEGATVQTNQTRGNDSAYAGKNLLDSTGDKYWSTDDAVTTPEAIIELPRSSTFNVIQLREYLPLGQRIDQVAIDRWTGTQWDQIATATSIGNRRLMQLSETVTTDKVRLRIVKAAACPAVWGFGLFEKAE